MVNLFEAILHMKQIAKMKCRAIKSADFNSFSIHILKKEE